MKKRIDFLNVDLDIQAKPEDNLESIVKDLGDSIFILQHQEYEGVQYLSFELADSCSANSPEALLPQFIEKIKNLSPEAKEAWNIAYKKEFNLGYLSGSNSDYLSNELSTDILRSISELGASLGITIYPFLSKKENKKRKKQAYKAIKKIKKKTKKENKK